MVGRGESLTLIVETDEGSFARTILPASDLGVHTGPGAEEATRSAAARWGLPDFVFHPETRRVGSGQREIGDVILFNGSGGAVVQVKHRAALSSDAQRETRWIEKVVAKARSQGAGTIRALCSGPLVLENLRGRSIEIDGQGLPWLRVVVLDHDDPPPDVVPRAASSGQAPLLVLLRRDWEFLFDQLRSTDAVLSYLRRVAAFDPTALGREPVRYYELAGADARAEPVPIDERVLGGGISASTPLLPRAPIGHDDNRSHIVIRMILEDIAATPVQGSPTEEQRLQVLAEIDTLPVGYRTEFGAHVANLVYRAATFDRPDEVLWNTRKFRRPGYPHLILSTCSQLTEQTQEAFRWLVMLRHYEFGEALGTVAGLATVGVLLTPRLDGRRAWDTTMARVEGDLDLTAEELAAFRRLWPRSGTDNSLTFGEPEDEGPAPT